MVSHIIKIACQAIPGSSNLSDNKRQSGATDYRNGTKPENVIIVDIHNQTDLKGLGRYTELNALTHIWHMYPVLA